MDRRRRGGDRPPRPPRSRRGDHQRPAPVRPGLRGTPPAPDPAEIDGLRSQLRDLRLRTDYATVELALESDGSPGESSSASPRDGLGGALDDALGSLSASLELLVRGLGVGIPILLVAGALALGARASRRRRRERALA